MKKESEFVREKVNEVMQDFVEEYKLHHDSDGSRYLIYPLMSLHDLWENCENESMYVDDNVELEHDLVGDKLDLLMDDLYLEVKKIYYYVKDMRRPYDLHNLD